MAWFTECLLLEYEEDLRLRLRTHIRNPGVAVPAHEILALGRGRLKDSGACCPASLAESVSSRPVRDTDSNTKVNSS